MSSSVALIRLLQLSSPALPVGAYTYSQGLEWAIDSGMVKDEADVRQWMQDLLEGTIGRFEAPLLAQLVAACQANDTAALAALNECYLASRETSELRAETVQMGYSLRKLLADLPEFPGCALKAAQSLEPISFPAAWACAAAAWQIDIREAICAYVWAWAENQVMAAIKAVPLGQTAGQRILLALPLAEIATNALALGPEDPCNFAPGLAIASSRHETQYSRLFRS